MTDHSDTTDSTEPGRRDFLGMVTTAGVAAGACACAVPFVQSLAPQDGASAHLPVDVDISKLAPGQQMTAVWQGKPVFILRRTPEDLKQLQDAALVADLRDPDSAVLQQPSYARNWHRSLVPEYGVYVGVCTHLGCVPVYEATTGGDNKGRYNCPCHGSKFDLAGRVRKGVPAPYNLPVPPHVLVSPTQLRLGESPKGESFDFSSIVQI
ncbi:ubiquinol-cytochrome c reductase iron-sulfur subunit [Acetobacter sicerae]|uniref:ubiquinol-cytochrome c reductase iron-sulfur subunit n=1 Tax=Acetobacter sicerae TaxID=85325 RepID=UPI00156B4B94|nr:ubiquinol-cytochrome c reductase iron-sulfur subunit [Acetobacter sicerae]NHN91545.1 ubiquinol-cytochrome c reductase iron-sulfur subunit [Acetobacter sicerae]